MTPGWEPDPGTQNECQNCGAHVTREFIRVFGTDGTVSGCPECMTNREITDGEAT